MKIEDLREEFVKAYLYLEICTDKASTHAMAVSEGRRLVAEKRQSILLEYAEDPKALGGNEAARTAAIDNMLGDAKAELTRLETEEQSLRATLEIARIRVEGLRAQLRCLEVMAAIEGAK